MKKGNAETPLPKSAELLDLHGEGGTMGIGLENKHTLVLYNRKSVLLLLVEEMLGLLLQRLELLLLAVVQHVLFFLRQVLADLFISSV